MDENFNTPQADLSLHDSNPFLLHPANPEGMGISLIKQLEKAREKSRLLQSEIKAKLLTFPDYLMADSDAREKAKERQKAKVKAIGSDSLLQSLQEQLKAVRDDLKLTQRALSGIMVEQYRNTQQLSLFDGNGQQIEFELVAKIKGSD